MALASCFTNARLNVKRDLGVRNLQSFVNLCKSMRLDISSGFSSLTSWITLFWIVESSLLPCGRGTLNSFKTPSQLRMVVALWVFLVPDTPPFSDLMGCLKKVKRNALVRNLLRQSNALWIYKPLNSRPTPLQMPTCWQFCSDYSRWSLYGIPCQRFSWWHHSCSCQLKTETGRYEKIPSNERICYFCNSNKTEHEHPFILDCKAYSKIRDIFFSKIELRLPNFKSLSHNNLVAHFMNSSHYLINRQLVYLSRNDSN